ncbi:hypothetical protein [Pseudoalteromonas luteoviolacea]|uniref:Uncharacterized protein n=1 Tax=Pseudoalteromonas luteoviolacea (strain 2ta16) TaxID=1353533 RepID=V4H9C8_PSEL2|nr:hypothetical protein [Pseudoalteromonas luteoviolacea]ESP94086.1 hypothetical protein PL2TA16_02463 [Pseudoalteromonas luteoviolacea 2ta16]KZN42748.1 hypothetical protein N483_10255 [Pseudoalteromonas luteoviolacea NCIMB 1944]
MRSIRGAVLGSLAIHGVIGYILFSVTPPLPIANQEKPLKVYVVSMDEPRKPVIEAVDTHLSEENVSEPISDKQPIISADEPEYNALERSLEQPEAVQMHEALQPENHQDANASNKVKVFKFNPHKGIQQLQQKEQEAYFGSRQFDTQAGAPIERMKTPKAHTQFLSGETEEIYRSQGRRLVKWKGKCYLFEDTSEMAQAGLPSSSGRPCPGELSNNESLLKQSLDKYLK